jgi:general secretion pathway protein G
MQNKSAFTMIEMLVVMFIIGIILAFVGPRVTRWLGIGAQQQIKFKLLAVKESLNMYRMEMGDYPREQEGLKALLENPRPNDDRFKAKAGKWPWIDGGEDAISHNGVPFIYNRPPKERKDFRFFEVIYPGTSGEENDPDRTIDGA